MTTLASKTTNQDVLQSEVDELKAALPEDAAPKFYTEEQSSNIRKISYDHDALEMRITFKNGGEYKYLKVPLAVYIEATKAPSIGGFFAASIKRVYDYEQVSKADANV